MQSTFMLLTVTQQIVLVIISQYMYVTQSYIYIFYIIFTHIDVWCDSVKTICMIYNLETKTQLKNCLNHIALF